MLELDCCDAIHRQSLRRAIEAAELNAEYRQHRKRIAALVPKNKISPEWF